MKKLFYDRKKILVLIPAIFLFCACQKWLDIAPENDLIKNDFWKKTADANSALAGTYSAFRDAALESFIWGEVRGDMAAGFPGDFSLVEKSQILTTNSTVTWNKYYSVINLANTLMYFDKNVMANDKSFTQKMKDGIDAEALFLRSLSYFYLVRLWKNVPLVTRPSISDTCNIYPYISSESEIIKQITTDLLIAKDKAYTTEFLSDPAYFRGRANKYTIMTLLADVYLWDQQYKKCSDYCDSVISSGYYSLLSGLDVNTWFTMYNPGNSTESIFELQFKDDLTANQTNPMFNRYIGYGATFTLIDLNSNPPKASFGKGPNFPSIFVNAGSDIRSCLNTATTNPAHKYAGIDYLTNVTRSLVGQRDAPIIYYRYADILLMKAEALNELGNISGVNNFDEVESYATQTAERAGLLPIAGITDRDSMRNAILDERAKEFVWEGKRWFDVLRTGKRNHFANRQYIIARLGLKVTGATRENFNSLATDTMMYYLPISYDELKRNKNLIQNEFYTK